jgi:hypothetical protein
VLPLALDADSSFGDGDFDLIFFDLGKVGFDELFIDAFGDVDGGRPFGEFGVLFAEPGVAAITALEKGRQTIAKVVHFLFQFTKGFGFSEFTLHGFFLFHVDGGGFFSEF